MKVSFYVLIILGIGLSCEEGLKSSSENANFKNDETVSNVISYKKLDNFASGSGMAFFNNFFYIVGDDDPYLTKVNNEGEIIVKWQLWDTTNVQNGRINKKVKHDFEAMSLFPFKQDTVFLIFGSGSVTPTRDLIYTFNPSTEKLSHLEGEAFFTWLKQAAELTDEEINLEGACFSNDKLFLFNRHNNEVYTLSASNFLKFIEEGETSNLTLEKNHFILPTYKGDTARFSGASIIEGENKILFSASIETTDQWEDDGDILGSFIGVIKLNEFDAKTPYFCKPVYQNDSTRFEGKIEALHGFTTENDKLSIYFITDDDDGTTGWGRIKPF